MKKVIISLIMLSAGVFYSCQKADNLTPAPTVGLDSAIYSLDGENFTVNATSVGRVARGSTVTLKLTMTAQGGFEQIDYKIYGNSPNLFVNGVDSSFINQNVPFDWVGLNTLRTGFDSEKSTKLKIRFAKITQVTRLNFIVTDKNLLQTYYELVITPGDFGLTTSNVQLYTQTATLADVGGVAANKTLFYSLNEGLAFDTTTKANGIAEFGVLSDSLSNNWFVSADLGKSDVDTLIKFKIIKKSDRSQFASNFPGGVARFVLVPDPLVLNNVFQIEDKFYIDKLKFEAGKSYAFKTGNNQSGVITINSIQNSTSGAVNAVVNFSYKSIVLRQ